MCSFNQLDFKSFRFLDYNFITFRTISYYFLYCKGNEIKRPILNQNICIEFFQWLFMILNTDMLPHVLKFGKSTFLKKKFKVNFSQLYIYFYSRKFLRFKMHPNKNFQNQYKRKIVLFKYLIDNSETLTFTYNNKKYTSLIFKGQTNCIS